MEKISSQTPSSASDPTMSLKFKVWLSRVLSVPNRTQNFLYQGSICFKILQTEIRFEDVASGCVRYSDREEVLLPLPVPKVSVQSPDYFEKI